MTTTSLRLIAWSERAPVAAPPAHAHGPVQLLSTTYKPPASLEAGEAGILHSQLAANGNDDDAMTPEDFLLMREVVAGSVRRQAYHLWFVKGGGRVIESALSSKLRQLVAGSELQQHLSDRFQSTVREAFRLEVEKEDRSLLEKCEEAAARPI